MLAQVATSGPVARVRLSKFSRRHHGMHPLVLANQLHLRETAGLKVFLEFGEREGAALMRTAEHVDGKKPAASGLVAWRPSPCRG